MLHFSTWLIILMSLPSTIAFSIHWAHVSGHHLFIVLPPFSMDALLTVIAFVHNIYISIKYEQEMEVFSVVWLLALAD